MQKWLIGLYIFFIQYWKSVLLVALNIGQGCTKLLTIHHYKSREILADRSESIKLFSFEGSTHKGDEISAKNCYFTPMEKFFSSQDDFPS